MVARRLHGIIEHEGPDAHRFPSQGKEPKDMVPKGRKIMFLKYRHVTPMEYFTAFVRETSMDKDGNLCILQGFLRAAFFKVCDANPCQGRRKELEILACVPIYSLKWCVYECTISAKLFRGAADEP